MAKRAFLWRPVLADPPLCALVDLKTRLTLDDVLDLHEALDLRDELTRRAKRKAEREK